MSKRTHIDLGAGLGGWTAPFQAAAGWQSVGVDIRADLEADVIGDIRHLPVDCSPTLLTMSPPCTEFARWMLPWCDQETADLSLVEACLDAVEELAPTWWILENSRGLKQYWGRQETKRVGPYYLWGDFPPFDVALSDGGKMQISGENPEQRAEIPFELADALRRAIEWQ